jgi:hypothetical protein
MMATQKEMRRGVSVGGGFFDVTSVTSWYRAGHFKTDEEALGAFKLAHQQALDGMGASHAEWMGLTADEFNAWMRTDALPPSKKAKGTAKKAAAKRAR